MKPRARTKLKQYEKMLPQKNHEIIFKIRK